MNDDIMIVRMNNLEKKFDQWHIKDEIEFNNTHDDICTFVFYRYLQLICNRDIFEDVNIVNTILEQQKQYQRNNSKIQNFVKMHLIDYFWVKTQFTIYWLVIDNKYAFMHNICNNVESLKTWIEENRKSQ